MRNYIREIRENTAGMQRQEKAEYILTYYWYHILGLAAAVGLVLFLIIHFGFREAPPLFTCVMVNQEINFARDEEMEEGFAGMSGIDKERLEINSDFNISYKDTKLEGVNESSYEKFFFKWQNKELDAVIMPESFFEYCKELGGGFYSLDRWDTEGLPIYASDGVPMAVKAEETGLADYLENGADETLLLVFPDTGQHLEECGEFLKFIQEMGERDDGGKRRCGQVKNRWRG